MSPEQLTRPPREEFIYLSGDNPDPRAEAILQFMGKADFVFGYDRECTGLCVKFANYLAKHTKGIVKPLGMQGAMLKALNLPQEDATKESLFLERVVLNKETEHEVEILRLSRGSLAITRSFGYGNKFSEFIADVAEKKIVKS